MNFCSNCGSNNIKFQIPIGDTLNRFCCINCDSTYYTNPKIVVGCILQYKNQLLLCERNIEPQIGYLTFPAGYMENYETIQSCCIRESKEEAGAIVINPTLFAVYNLPTSNQVFFVFHHHLKNQELLKHDHETKSIEWHSCSEIPYDKLAFPIIKEAMRALVTRVRYPYQATITKTAKGYHHNLLEFPEQSKANSTLIS